MLTVGQTEDKVEGDGIGMQFKQLLWTLFAFLGDGLSRLWISYRMQ